MKKVWVTKGFFPTTSKGGGSIGVLGSNISSEEMVALQKKFHSAEEMAEEDWIAGYYSKFGRRGSTIVKELRDVCIVRPGLQLISQRFFDLLQDFETGQAEFRKMPMYGPDAKTPVPQTYYTVRFLGQPALMVADESVGLRPSSRGEGIWGWYGSGKTDKLALRVPDDFALDIWIDWQLPQWVFVSDRLKEAIKETGIKGYEFTFKQCRLLK